MQADLPNGVRKHLGDSVLRCLRRSNSLGMPIELRERMFTGLAAPLYVLEDNHFL